MLPKLFQSNPSKRYKVSSIYQHPDISLVNQISISSSKHFIAHFPNLFEKYRLPQVKNDDLVKNWQANPMQFWQNQINFVVWCSTTGCGVSYDHLQHDNFMIRNFYRFHFYYTSRRLLKQMFCPTSFEGHWNVFQQQST